MSRLSTRRVTIPFSTIALLVLAACTTPLRTQPPVMPTVPAAVDAVPGGSFPGADSTGVPKGTALTTSGALRVTTPGATLSGLDVTGGIVVDAPGVTIANSLIHGEGDYGILVRSGSLTLTDSTIRGFDNGLAGDGWTARRVEITGQHDDGVKLGSNVLLADSWIHTFDPSPGAHSDGAQLQSGEVNVTVTHNSIDPTSASGESGNSALFIAPDLGPSSPGPVTITNNLLGGGNYTLYCVDGNNGQYTIANITITGNTFTGKPNYGPTRIDVPVTFSNNVHEGTGAPVPR